MRLYVLAGLLVAPSFAQQQVTSGTLSGLVEDATGAPLAGSQMEMLNLDRNQVELISSDSQGRFQFLYLVPGSYKMTATDPRFAPYSRVVSIAAGQALSFPVRLGLAERNEAVTVSASVNSVETVRSQMAEYVGTWEVDSLPLNGRNYLDLALLAPGVSRTNTGSTQQFAETSAVPGTGISFASQRNLNNNFVLDGLSINDDAAGLAGTFFSQEVIREFRVINSGAVAELGRASSGFVTVTTKSGTNAWHGRAYGFLRNQRIDARNALATRKEPLTQTQYGASLGGPIRKDRTFVFSNFEQSRRQSSGFVTIAPANVAAINATGARIGTGQYGTGYKIANGFARVDHQLSSAHQLMGRYSVYDLDSSNARGVGGLSDVSRATRLATRDHILGLSSVASLSPSSLNEARFQFTRSRLAAPGNDTFGPSVSISGIANYGASTTSPVGRDNNGYELSDNVSLVRGGHTLRAGVDLLWNRLNIFFPGSAVAAVYSFSSLANFQAGRYATFQQAFGDPYQFQSNPNLGMFVQDGWKLSPRWTLQLGLRYDVQKLPSPIRTDVNNIAPRFGVAFSPGVRTVIRANYGLFYDRIPLRATSNALQRDGSRYRTAVLPFGQPGAPVFPAQLTAFPPNQLVNITTIDFGIQNGYSQQAGLQIEHEFGSKLLVSAGYQWLRGLHLILSRSVNVGRPNPNFGNISRYEGAGDSYFNGLLLSIRARPIKGVEVRTSYTFSKAIDNVGNNFFSSPQDNFDLRDDRGLSDNDQRHRLTVSSVLDLPWSFRLSPLFIYTSELPFNVQLGFDRNGDTSLNDRPIGVGRNTGRGFDYASLDVRLSRSFAFGERSRLEVLAESFNTLNRVNRSVPNNTFGQGATPLAAFGRATAVNDPRQAQIGLRLSF